MTSFPVGNKPRYLGNHTSQIKSYYGSLSGSHARSFRIHHEKSPKTPPSGEITMTSYLVGNKPRYLGNHASQIKRFYGTLPGSHGRSFRIRHVKSPVAPSGGEMTMTLYPACNKTSLSRKPYITYKKLLYIWITIFQNTS